MNKTLLLGMVLAAGGLMACGQGGKPAASDPSTQGSATTMDIKSEAFKANEVVPKKYTGEGEDTSPPLAWSAAPAGTKELALIMDDPDAPNGDWVHWLVYKLPADRQSLPEGFSGKGKKPEQKDILMGTTSARTTGYHGPMPPPGHGVHHYHFKLYALDAPLDLPAGATKPQLLAAMKGHILAQGELVGTYERK